MPVSINHQTSTYLPVTSPSKTSYRHHCSSTYKSSYSSLSDKCPRYSSSYSRLGSLSDDSGLSITGTSCVRDRSESSDSTFSRYSKARSSSSSDSTSLKPYTSSTLSRRVPSRFLSDLPVSDSSVSEIRSRFSSIPKSDSSRASKLSESRSYGRSESLQPLVLSHKKSSLASTIEPSGPCEEVNDENHNSVSSEDNNANLSESVQSSDECNECDEFIPSDGLKFSDAPLEQPRKIGKLNNIYQEQPVQPKPVSIGKKSEESMKEPVTATKNCIDSDDSQLSNQDGSYLKDLKDSLPKSSSPFSAGAVTSTGGLNGLRNIGNTCFLNSVVQCLSNTPQLKEYLTSGAYLSEINTESRGALIKSFADLIRDIWQGENKIINTTSFKSQIQRFAPRFMGYSQQDAQEFLRYLLEGLHEDVNRVTNKPRDYSQIDDHLSEHQKALESWKRYLRCDNSKIVDLFVGQLKSTLKCTVCGHCSTTYEVFWDLSLPLPSRISSLRLSQCLDHFTKEEILDGDEMPTCSKCKVRRKCSKGFTIQKLPIILVLHLKRFSPTERFRKLSATVDFPLTDLDMSPYMDSSANNPETPLYNLYAVSNHNGNTHSGHYTAYCRQPQANTWYHFNDARVTPLPTRHVVSSEAYILFYQQNGQRL